MGTRHTAAGPPWVVWTCSAILPQDCTACTQSLHSMGRVPGELWGTWAPWATCSWSGKWATWTVAGARTMRATRATRASTPYTPGGPVPTMSCTCSLHAWPLLSRLCVPVCVAFCIAKSLPCHEFPVFPCVSCLAARAGLHPTLFHLAVSCCPSFQWGMTTLLQVSSFRRGRIVPVSFRRGRIVPSSPCVHQYGDFHARLPNSGVFEGQVRSD